MRFPARDAPRRIAEWLRALGRRALRDRSATILVATNLLAALLAFGVEGAAASLLFVYWTETVIIGALNIVKMYLAPPRSGTRLDRFPFVKWTLAMIARTLIALVFILHYGIFAFVTGGLILGLGPWGFSLYDERMPPFGEVMRLHLWPVLLLAASHGWSLVSNYIGRREYRTSDLEDLMARPYKRLALMVVLVWPGVIFADKFGSPMLAIAVVFVPLKIVADLVGHFQDHQTADVG